MLMGAASDTAYFAGFTVNYGQALSGKWSWNGALAWDNEKSRERAQASDSGRDEDKRVNTFTAIATAGYMLTRRLDLSFGLGKGFADDDNADSRIRFANGDWSTGASFGWTFWQRAQRRLNLSLSAEYNMSQHEPSFSLDLGYGISF